MTAASKVISDDNVLYWLDISKLEFPNDLLKKLDRLYLSKKEFKKLQDEVVIYHYNDRTTKKFKLKELESFSDLTNGTGNWYGGNSVLDALYKVVSNSEMALDAKNINLDFAGKYLVGGDSTSDNVYEQPLSKGEKKSIEDVVTSGKKVTAVKSQINIARFVENIAQLELDKSFLADYYIIGKLYNINRDVLEANLERGSTFDNQSVARASHIEYTLKPKGEDLVDGIKSYFGLENRLELSWDHLLFTQVLKKDEADVKKTTADTIKTLVDAGLTIDSINELLEIEIELTPKKNSDE